MTLKQDLIRVGYLPENLPPPFRTEKVSAFFDNNPSSYLSVEKQAVRSANYNASKRGMSRRNFSVVHPITAHDLAEFVGTRSNELNEFFSHNRFSLSIPRHTPDSDRAIEIATHSELEGERLARLSGYRFIVKTDISRFYHSVYTHSVPWAYHGKSAAKTDRRLNSKAVFFNRLDYTLRQGQDGQTIGIPVGPDASRYIAELITTAIDQEFVRRCEVRHYDLIRHVDDVWIGTHTHADAENVLWRYREALREFELDINESKTRIYAENFHFSDAWPSDVSSRLEHAASAAEHRKADRLRAALEFAFSLSTSDGDDGILKYAIRQLDRSDLNWNAWPTVQPFLMRSAIHFGHTIDFVARVLVWRDLARDDLDRPRWTTIILSILDRHGRLGNDSEVCWSLFVALRLHIEVPEETGRNIVMNCSALSILALLNCVDAGLATRSLFDAAFELLGQETANGPMWPVFLEWRARRWPKHSELRDTMQNETIENMATAGVTIFDGNRLTRVFSGVAQPNYANVPSAIEARGGLYDEDDDEEEEEEKEEEEEDESAIAGDE